MRTLTGVTTLTGGCGTGVGLTTAVTAVLTGTASSFTVLAGDFLASRTLRSDLVRSELEVSTAAAGGGRGSELTSSTGGAAGVTVSTPPLNRFRRIEFCRLVSSKTGGGGGGCVLVSWGTCTKLKGLTALTCRGEDFNGLLGCISSGSGLGSGRSTCFSSTGGSKSISKGWLESVSSTPTRLLAPLAARTGWIEVEAGRLGTSRGVELTLDTSGEGHVGPWTD